MGGPQGLLKPIGHPPIAHWVSIYADDAALFINNSPSEACHAAAIMKLFGDSSGLQVNLAKRSMLRIKYQDPGINLAISDALPCVPGSFPCAYVGMPLSPTRLRGSDFQPLIEGVAKKLSGWNVQFLSSAGRLVLACFLPFPHTI